MNGYLYGTVETFSEQTGGTIMKKRIISALLAVLLLSSCGAPAANPGANETDSGADTTANDEILR